MEKIVKCKLCFKTFKRYLPKSRIKAGKGKYCSEKCRRKAFSNLCKIANWERVGLRGEKSPSWQGGITKKNKLERCRFRREIQKRVFERDNYTCQMCGERGVALQVDHIQPWAEYVEMRFDINNCRTLCQKCHYKITFGKEMPKNIKVWGHNLKHNLHLTIRKQL